MKRNPEIAPYNINKKIVEWVNSELPNKAWFYKSRKHAYVVKRNCVAFVLRKNTPLPLQEIGYLLRKDHSVILHALKYHEPRTRSKLAIDRDYRDEFERLQDSFDNFFNRTVIRLNENNNWELNYKN